MADFAAWIRDLTWVDWYWITAAMVFVMSLTGLMVEEKRWLSGLSEETGRSPAALAFVLILVVAVGSLVWPAFLVYEVGRLLRRGIVRKK